MDKTQLPLWGNMSCQAKDDVRYAIEVSHARGIAVAFGTEPDGRQGSVKITIGMEIDEVTVRLIQKLIGEGWTRNERGVEWTVVLPPDIFTGDYTYAQALAYAKAFTAKLREMMLPIRMIFKLECKYTTLSTDIE